MCDSYQFGVNIAESPSDWIPMQLTTFHLEPKNFTRPDKNLLAQTLDQELGIREYMNSRFSRTFVFYILVTSSP